MISYDEAYKTAEDRAKLYYIAHGKLANSIHLLYFLSGYYKNDLGIDDAMTIIEDLVINDKAIF